METVKVKVMEPGFQVPVRGSAGAGAFDLRAGHCVYVAPGQSQAVRTYLQMEFPDGLCGLIVPRSGLGSKGIVLANTVGLIDSDYRGEIMVVLFNRNKVGSKAIKIEEGDRIAQMIFFRPVLPALVEASSVGSTERGEGGFGSTGVS